MQFTTRIDCVAFSFNLVALKKKPMGSVLMTVVSSCQQHNSLVEFFVSQDVMSGGATTFLVSLRIP
jgi:hypothetical protein